MFGASVVRTAVAVAAAGRDSAAATGSGACCAMLATITAITWQPAIVPFLKEDVGLDRALRPNVAVTTASGTESAPRGTNATGPAARVHGFASPLCTAR